MVAISRRLKWVVPLTTDVGILICSYFWYLSRLVTDYNNISYHQLIRLFFFSVGNTKMSCFIITSRNSWRIRKHFKLVMASGFVGVRISPCDLRQTEDFRPIQFKTLDELERFARQESSPLSWVLWICNLVCNLVCCFYDGWQHTLSIFPPF